MINFASKERFKLIHVLFYSFAFLFLILECGFFYRFSFFSVKPNLILLLVTFYIFYFSFRIGHVVAFCLFCGLLKDMMSGVAPGTHVLVLVCLGILLRYLAKRFLRYNWVFIIFLFVAATFLHAVLYFVVQRCLFSAYVASWWTVVRIAMIELVYGLFLFGLFFRIIKQCVIDKLS